MSSKQVIPWALWLRQAAEIFHIPPDAFWHLSLWEWRALTLPYGYETPIARKALDDLMVRFPDKKQEHDHHVFSRSE